MPNHLKLLIALHTLFQAGRLFTGAICVLYFMSFGGSAADYAWIKSTQAAVFIVSDVPLGHLMQRIGERKAMLTSVLFGLMGCTGYLLSTTLSAFLISEISLALSISIWPVAFTSYSMHHLQKLDQPGLAEVFFHKGDSISNLGVLATGVLGGFLYKLDKTLPYYSFLGFYAVLLMLAAAKLSSPQPSHEEPEDATTNIPELLKRSYPYVSVAVLSQFLMQPLFHYWQPFFLERFNIDSVNMSAVFVSYSLAMSSISYLYAKLSKYAFMRSDSCLIGLVAVSSLLYLLISHTSCYASSVIIFSLLYGMMNLTRVSSSVSLQHHIPKEERMIATKWVSFIARLGMSMSLLTITFLIRDQGQVESLYHTYGIIMLASSSVLCMMLLYRARQEPAYTHL